MVSINLNNKKISIIFGIALCLIVGGTLSFESLARFTKKFNDNKIIKASNFEVTAISNFEDTEIKPGDIIGKDIITLKNDNNYPVEFTVNLKAIDDSEKEFLKYLVLNIEGLDSTNTDNQYKTILEANTIKEVYTKVEWPYTGDEIDASLIEGAVVRYEYDIKAKQLDKNGDGSLGSNNGEGGSTSNGTTGGITTPPTDIGGTGGENTDEGNTDNDSNGSTNEVSSIALKDIQWIANSSSNQDKIVRDISGDLIPVASYSYLENLKFDFLTQKIVFNADIEVLNNNKSINNGFNFTLGIKNGNNVTGSNNFTYQFYKDTLSKIYLKIPKYSLDSSASLSQLVTSKDIETEKTKLTLSAEIKLNESGKVSCNMTVKDSQNLNDIICNKEATGAIYNDLDKFYINIGGLVSGVEGIKIKDLSVKVVDK